MDKQKRLVNIYEEEKVLRQKLSDLRRERITVMRALRVDGLSYSSIGKLYGNTKKQYIISLTKTYQPE